MGRGFVGWRFERYACQSERIELPKPGLVAIS